MRALLPVPDPASDVHEVYARDWLARSALRVNFVASADGAVAVHGLSRGLQTPGDNHVFAALRDLADVVLVGGGTARAENYRPVVADERRSAARARFGLAPLLPVAVVSARLDLDLDGPLLRPVEGAARAIVITHRASDPAARARLAEVADVLVAGQDRVDLSAAVHQLAERGLRRVVCEGGPSLFSALLAGGVVDELCLTVSPLLAGAGAGRITGGAPWAADLTPRLTVVSLLEEDDALFCRYRVG